MLKPSHLSFDWSVKTNPRVVCGIELVIERRRRFDLLSLVALAVGVGSLAVLGWVAWKDPMIHYRMRAWQTSATLLRIDLDTQFRSPFKVIAEALD